MKLKDWIKENRVGVTAFSKRIGLKNKSTLYAYFDGRKTPSRDTMELIIKETNHEVLPNDFYNIDAKPTGESANIPQGG